MGGEPTGTVLLTLMDSRFLLLGSWQLLGSAPWCVPSRLVLSVVLCNVRLREPLLVGKPKDAAHNLTSNHGTWRTP